MSVPIIEAHNVSKKYRIGEKERYLALRDKLAHPLEALKNIRNSSDFFALSGVNFEIHKGEALGIIGRNGAGKSTLLKILSRITPPSSGEVILRGRVGSLLEVGTGFHPELTGRENIYLNGSILGMRKQEIRKKMDEIISFSGIEKFIDTPVKRYSSGMFVRLAFSVAAHLEPDILIVDEVLAVGDIEFQKKCLSKMEQVTRSDGRTVILVSHNMSMIEQLCNRVLLLDKGSLTMDGTVKEVAKHYVGGMENSLNAPYNVFDKDDKKSVQLRSIKIIDVDGETKSEFSCDEEVFIIIDVDIRKPKMGLYGILEIKKNDGTVVFQSDSTDNIPNVLEDLELGLHSLELRIPARSIGHGEYAVFVQFVHNASPAFEIDNPGLVCSFNLSDNTTRRGQYRLGFLSTLVDWKKNNT